MNIKEHIEAGHYLPFKAYVGVPVPTAGGTAAKIFTAQCGGPYPIVGVVSIESRGWVALQWDENGQPETRSGSHWSSDYRLLPPPLRKVKVTAFRIVGPSCRGLSLFDTREEADRWARASERIVELTGEYEQGWD